MNEDAVKVRRIDLLSTFPALRLFEAIPASFHPVSFAASFLTVGAFLFLDSFFGLSIESRSGDLFYDLLGDLRFLSVRGLGAGTTFWLSTILKTILLTFTGVAVGYSIVNRMCRYDVSRSQAASANRPIWRETLVIWVLTWFLLSLSFVALRVGQSASSLFAGESTAGGISSFPAILAGLFFLVASAVILSAWLLSTTSVIAERSDGSEALSRCLSYCLSRPVRVCCLFLFGFGLSRFFALISTSLIHAAAELQIDRPQAGLRIGLEAVEQLANLFGQALAVSSLLSVCSIGYLLLRFVEDGVPLNHRS